MKKNEIVKIQKKPFPEKTYTQRELFQFQEMYGICIDPEKDLILTQSGQFVRNGHSEGSIVGLQSLEYQSMKAWLALDSNVRGRGYEYSVTPAVNVPEEVRHNLEEFSECVQEQFRNIKRVIEELDAYHDWSGNHFKKYLEFVDHLKKYRGNTPSELDIETLEERE